MSGVDLQGALTEQGIDIPVIVLTGHADKNRLVVLAVAIQKFVSDHVQMPVENRLSPQTNRCRDKRLGLERGGHGGALP